MVKQFNSVAASLMTFRITMSAGVSNRLPRLNQAFGDKALGRQVSEPVFSSYSLHSTKVASESLPKRLGAVVLIKPHEDSPRPLLEYGDDILVLLPRPPLEVAHEHDMIDALDRYAEHQSLSLNRRDITSNYWIPLGRQRME